MCHKLDPRALDPDRLTGYLDYLEGGPLAVTIPPLSVQNPDSYYLGARDAEAEVGAIESYSPPLSELGCLAKGYRRKACAQDQDRGWDERNAWDDEDVQELVVL